MKWLIGLAGHRGVVTLVGALVGIAVDRGLLSGEVGDALMVLVEHVARALGL